jgi:hypothetical protein
MWPHSEVFSPDRGDEVLNTYGDRGVVLKVTPDWVLIKQEGLATRDDSDGTRWVHREKFEDLTWTVDE